jgi:cytochrome c2
MLATGVAFQTSGLPAADPNRGAEVYRGQCAPCHSLEPEQHLIGPSLADVWGRKGGIIEGFPRYSDVLRKADVVWNEETLDRFVKDPQDFLPGNLMPFRGIKDDRERADLIVYLKAVGATEKSVRFKPPEDAGYLFHPLEIMDRNTYEAYTFDPHKDKPAKISYTVSKAGKVRIRLVRRADKALVLRTLQDWTRNRYGPVYSVEWDGKDASGNILDNKNAFVLFESMDPLGRGRAKIHLDHPKESCRDPELRIVSPRAGATIRGGTTIAVVFSESPRGTVGISAYDYEGRLYVDYSLVAKLRFRKGEEHRFALDTTQLANGPHVLTVNMDDLNDHIGTASTIVMVER